MSDITTPLNIIQVGELNLDTANYLNSQIIEPLIQMGFELGGMTTLQNPLDDTEGVHCLIFTDAHGIVPTTHILVRVPLLMHKAQRKHCPPIQVSDYAGTLFVTIPYNHLHNPLGYAEEV